MTMTGKMTGTSPAGLATQSSNYVQVGLSLEINASWTVGVKDVYHALVGY